MPRAVVVLPSTTYRAGDFIAAAESLDIDLVVASEKPPPLEMGDGYLQIDCSDPHAAAEAVAALGDDVALDGIVAADDSGVVVAALAGSSLGLPSNSAEAALATRDKLKMRERLAKGEVPQPRYLELAPGAPPAKAAETLGYPLIVKPVDRSASQGVIRVDRPEDLGPVLAKVRSILGDDGDNAPLLLEAYATGAEVAVEGLIRSGELTVLAIFDKPDASEGPSFPETIFVTPSRLSDVDRDECVRVSEAAIRALGLGHGPVHIELKVEDGKARVLEVAARSIGGLCSRSLNFGLMGTTLEALILRNAVGMDKPELKRAPHASGVLMIPIADSGRLVAVDGFDETRAIPGVTGIDLTIQVGDLVLAAPEGDRYLGFVFAQGKTPAQVETTLRRAMEILKVTVGQT